MKKEYNEDEIKALDWTEHIRLRPQMYFNACFEEGTLDALPIEMACHAIDEYFDKNCDSLKITVFENHFSLEYNAGISLETTRGIAYTKAEDIFTRMYACSNEKKHLAVGEEFCRIGVKSINAVAERCDLMTIHHGKKGTFVFKGGKTASRKIEDVKAINTTKIIMKLNHGILNNLTFTVEGIREKAAELSQKLEGFNIEVEVA